MTTRLHIVADANIPALEDTFARHGSVSRTPGRAIDRQALADADVLLVRSVTRVDADLLAGTRVRFVGSATIGTDHLDTQWLDAAGIAWSAAPGCNADAAAQYSLAMMLLACRRLGRELHTQSLGIVGRGNVGSRLEKILTTLGVTCISCDPPLAAAGVSGLADLEPVLGQDIVSLHVPLTDSGRWPTRRMIDAENLRAMRPGALLLNAARGEVVDGEALLERLATGRLHAALDTWPGEPSPDSDLVAACTVATPHVAGYSLEGRLRGTAMVYQAFCDHAGISKRDRGDVTWPPALTLPWPENGGLEQLLLEVASVATDDASLRALAGEARLAEGFDALRRDYHWRRDWSGIRVSGAVPSDQRLLGRLGFTTGE